jgi:hypothetical protein
VVERVGTQDEAVGVKIHVAKGQAGAAGKGRASCSCGRARRCHEHENGRHGKCLGGTDVHCEEALPVTANDSAAGTEVFEDSCGKLDTFDRGL